MARVGVRKLGETDGPGLEQLRKRARGRAQWHQGTGRAQKERGARVCGHVNKEE
jgi:hypothetical protein